MEIFQPKIATMSHYAKIIESDISFAADELNTILPNIVQCGQYIAKALSKISDDINEPSAKIKLLQEGMVCAYVCLNAQTYISHTELDCAYTMIVSPLCALGLNDYITHAFEFQWNGNDNLIEILMTQGSTIYYSGYGISHRQKSLFYSNDTNRGTYFWNISSYANKRLFDNAMATFRRHKKFP